jgi:glycine oxidase
MRFPRRDGHILIGSTLEHEGYDKTPTDVGAGKPQGFGGRVDSGVGECRSGGALGRLAPGSPEGIPYIGRVPGFAGLWLNCGHYRNGLVLAPASCQLFADVMLGRSPIIDPVPYAPAGRI